ncbi:MAG TPA: TlyA family RNA methyltransferase [Candidatus Dormibacteraeota bacterium]|nr:TlyA family RNA methyltransferase [Candidatus Dormibacteraeota bacterium]
MPRTARAPRRRLDLEIVSRGLAPSRERAQALVRGGAIRVDGELVTRPSALIGVDSRIAARTEPDYVSRGAEKLAGALDAFGLQVEGWSCADVGASTGGFTDVLLRRGAVRVYAIDVGKGQLAWRLRQDPRVVVMEGVNVRELASLPETVDLIAADVSFISLRLALPPVLAFLRDGGHVVALVKPQFEAGPAAVSRGGVVRDPGARAASVLAVSDALAAHGLGLQAIARSGIRGREGNVEIFCHFQKGMPRNPLLDAAARAAEESR